MPGLAQALRKVILRKSHSEIPFHCGVLKCRDLNPKNYLVNSGEIANSDKRLPKEQCRESSPRSFITADFTILAHHHWSWSYFWT